MKNFKIIIIFSLFLTSCFVFKNISESVKIESKSNVCVLPFINNSETPSSGLKVKNIVENFLFTKKIKISSCDLVENDNFTDKDLKDYLESLKSKNIDFVFFGYVNEWRYKAGVDSEPAVSLTINLYDLKNDKLIWSASGSKTSSSYKSIGIVSQELIKKLLSKIKSK